VDATGRSSAVTVILVCFLCFGSVVSLRLGVGGAAPPRFALRGRKTEGGGQKSPEIASENAPPANHLIVTLATGREEWNRLANVGLVVFSKNEMIRLHTACSGMSEADRGKALALLADVKQAFAGAYIQRGVAA
jgi:hypothetical protein